jgi:hypothetical protein
MLRKFLLYLCLATLTQCSKCKREDPAPADQASQLPPATQTGANTFGCLVNGKPYTPQGRVGLGSNFAVSYDPTFNGGDLIVSTYSAAGTANRQYLSVLGNHIKKAGNYQFSSSNEAGAFFDDNTRTVSCDYYDSRNSGSFSKGAITITRLDLQAGVVAGTFAVSIAKPGCDTLKVTQGRFDAKL